MQFAASAGQTRASTISGRQPAGARALPLLQRPGRVATPTRRANRCRVVASAQVQPQRHAGASGPSKQQLSSQQQQQPDAAPLTTLVGGGEEASAVGALTASIAVGALLGWAGLGLDESLPAATQHLSASIGWSYFICWSVSFWPQILDNQRTRDVSGLSPDYLLFSLLGYVCYAAYTGALYFSDDVRASYAAAHAGSAPDVSPADFAFAAHAVFATILVSGQYAAMRPPGAGGVSSVAAGVAGAALVAVAAGAAHIGATCDASDCASWLPMLVLLGGVKVACTLIKYTPQVLLNHRRRSTEGWSLTNVLLDLGGGVLSLGQVVLDAAARHDLSVITGSPAKLWIAALSIGYDLIFVAQHYALYRDEGGGAAGSGGNAAAGEGAAAAAAPTPSAPMLPPAGLPSESVPGPRGTALAFVDARPRKQ